MYQGIKELRAARGRTALIIVTVGMITVLVTFLSSLAAGLAQQSVSALQDQLGDNKALILQDTGTTNLSTSRLNNEQLTKIEDAGGQPLYMARDKVGSDTVILLSSEALAPGTVQVPGELKAEAESTYAADPAITTIEEAPKELYLDHQPVILANPDLVVRMPGASTAAAVAESNQAAMDVANGMDGAKVLTGKDRWNASASYSGEQTSLNLMIVLLYVISALVLGAFFTVWTMQRLRGVAISSALGASRKVLVADSLSQAALVLAIGITSGVLITLAAGTAAGSAMPVVLDSSTLLRPAGILALAGILGAAVSIKPVLSVSPRTALQSA
ncbi:MAG TPA: ABC transporter permease [Candidatus Corynebacterium gallistercoris]|uniref:ABC transporter permease n=1 Tax=Candidatus Corynebacterium gallistercoris TaxID=2838530 RepID=A0A9D1RZ15_9CORY|nr:ABC transporter permease [Candidatus Corynebacterium gallistercoris]